MQPTPVPDWPERSHELAQLLARSGLGDRAAFARLYESTAGHLLAVVLRIQRDRALAEDLLQEVYVNVWKAASGFDAARSQPLTWLTSIARNRAIDSLRRQSTQPRLESSHSPGDDGDEDHDRIDATPDGRRVLVADWYRNRLLVIDAQRRDSEAVEIEVGKAPAGVASDSDGRTVYVAERDDDSVAVVDLDSRRVSARVHVGTHPFALLLDAPRRRLYALNVLSDDLSVIDLKRLAVVATVKVGRAPYGAALAHGGALLYVTNQHGNTVSVIDAESLAVQRTLGGFAYPEGIASHGERVYVVNWMDDNVAVLDAESGRTLDTIATGSNSRGFGAFIGAPPTP